MIREKTANWLRKINGYHLLGYLGTAMIYPVFALITSGGRKVKFIDAATIVGLVFLAAGVICSMARHGDFDIMEYVTRRSAASMRHEKMKPFSAFREDKAEKRKENANYPLLTGIAMLVLSGVLAAVS